MENKGIAKLLYNQRISVEKPIEAPDGESLALLEMFEEINALGYDFHYLADIDLRPINDVKVMRLLWKYLPRMESIFTIQKFIRRIDPKKIPEALDYSVNMFCTFSPSDKMHLTGFDKAISKGQKNDEYFLRISELLNDGDSYAALSETRKTLGKYRPELLRVYTNIYKEGVLLPLALRDCAFYTDGESTDFLNHCLNITSEELVETIGKYDYKTNGYKYPLSVTAFEYWRALCTRDFVRNQAVKALRKREKAKPS